MGGKSPCRPVGRIRAPPGDNPTQFRATAWFRRLFRERCLIEIGVPSWDAGGSGTGVHVPDMSLTPLGPALPPHLAGEGPSEHLPLTQTHELKGHEGPVFAVRFNAQGTYCLTGGKVRGGPEGRC